MSNIITSEKNGHYLSFNERVHIHTLDGRSVPGGTTFTKGGYPTSFGLIEWQKRLTAEEAIRLAWQERENTPEGKELTKARAKELVKEAKKNPDSVMNAAAAIGTTLHDYAYNIELGNLEKAEQIRAKAELLPDYPILHRCIEKFKNWHSKTQDTVVASEAIVAQPCRLHWTEADLGPQRRFPDTDLCLCFAGKFDRLITRNGKLILSDFKTSSGIRLDMFLQLAAYKMAIEYWLNLKVDGLEILRFGKEGGEFETLLIDSTEDIQALEEQVMVCRRTFAFDKKWSKDRRFAYIPEPKGKHN